MQITADSSVRTHQCTERLKHRRQPRSHSHYTLLYRCAVDFPPRSHRLLTCHMEASTNRTRPEVPTSVLVERFVWTLKVTVWFQLSDKLDTLSNSVRLDLLNSSSYYEISYLKVLEASKTCVVLSEECFGGGRNVWRRLCSCLSRRFRVQFHMLVQG